MTPQGHPLQQSDLQRWATDFDQLVLLCGHYEGFDERIRTLADEEVSLGDFVLTGGELPAMTIINGVVRLLPGTVGSAESLVEESHRIFCWNARIDRLNSWNGGSRGVAQGDHGAIARWLEHHVDRT